MEKKVGQNLERFLRTSVDLLDPDMREFLSGEKDKRNATLRLDLFHHFRAQQLADALDMTKTSLLEDLLLNALNDAIEYVQESGVTVEISQEAFETYKGKV